MNPSPPTNPPAPGSATAPPDPAASNFAPSIVQNIPMRTPAGPAKPLNEDAELDKIMQDVGQKLKSEDKKPTKKHRLFFRRKSKAQSEAKLHAQPLQPLSAAQPSSPARPRPQPLQSPAPISKPAETRSAPVMVITLTIIVASLLIAAAFYAYKK